MQGLSRHLGSFQTSWQMWFLYCDALCFSFRKQCGVCCSIVWRFQKYVISQITLATLLARSYLWLNGNKIICLKWLDLCKETGNLLNAQKLHQSILLGSLDLSSHEVNDTLTWAPPPLQYRSLITAHCNCSASLAVLWLRLRGLQKLKTWACQHGIGVRYSKESLS